MKIPRPVAAALFALCSILVASLLAQCGENAVAEQSKPLPQPGEGDRIRFLISGSMLGRLEPCGCASGQLGGLARRMQHIGEHRSYDLLLEGGDLVDSATELDVQKMFTAVQVLFGMQHPYDAIGVGSKDLALPRDEWCSFLAGAQVVASDLQCAREDWPGKPFVEKDVRGMKVRIASFTLTVPEQPAGADAVRLLPPADAWRAALAGAGEDTLRVLMLHGSDTVARALVPTLAPPPDLVVCCDRDAVEPSNRPEHVGAVPMVLAGIRGRVLLDLMFVRSPEGPRVSCEPVPLAGSKTLPGGGGDPDVKQVLLAHRDQVAQDGIQERMSRQLPTPNGAAYVGSEACRTCHATAYEAWAKTKHFHAWDTLVKAETDPSRYGWPVTKYPDCVSCHVVGFREKTGFVTFDETPHLSAVGCERCHGPGSEHLQSPEKNRLGIHGGVPASVLCTQCHDFEQSPDFLYGDRWKVIEHGREPK
jgi:hypothetical protein